MDVRLILCYMGPVSIMNGPLQKNSPCPSLLLQIEVLRKKCCWSFSTLKNVIYWYIICQLAKNFVYFQKDSEEKVILQVSRYVIKKIPDASMTL